MDSFVRVHTEAGNEGPFQGTLTMGYYTRADLPYYYALADAFTLCDGYHCSVMGPTHPNRLMQMSGTLDPARPGRWPGDRDQRDPARPCSACSWDTMPEVLEDAGVSWKYYNPAGALYSIDAMRKHRPHHRQRAPLLLPVPEPVVGAVPEGLPPDLPERLRRRRAGPARCPRSAGSAPRSATTSTPRRRPSWASGSPTRCCRPWWPTPTCGRRRSCSTCTTRTTGSSTTSPRRSPRPAPPGST